LAKLSVSANQNQIKSRLNKAILRPNASWVSLKKRLTAELLSGYRLNLPNFDGE